MSSSFNKQSSHSSTNDRLRNCLNSWVKPSTQVPPTPVISVNRNWIRAPLKKGNTICRFHHHALKWCLEISTKRIFIQSIEIIVPSIQLQPNTIIVVLKHMHNTEIKTLRNSRCIIIIILISRLHQYLFFKISIHPTYHNLNHKIWILMLKIKREKSFTSPSCNNWCNGSGYSKHNFMPLKQILQRQNQNNHQNWNRKAQINYNSTIFTA